MKKRGVSLPSNDKIRQVRKEIVLPHLSDKMMKLQIKNETAPDSVGGYVEREVPFTYLQRLPAFLEEQLEKYYEYDIVLYFCFHNISCEDETSGCLKIFQTL